MDYEFAKDLRAIREILDLSQAELAGKLGVEQITISRSESGLTKPSAKLIESAYSYAFNKGLRIGRVKEMLWNESLEDGHKLLFHGAKDAIEGAISAVYGRRNNDFGQGFYAGESYEQALSFVSGYDNSKVYYLAFDPEGLTCRKYSVNQEWMMTIAYYRGAFGQYKNHPVIEQLIKQSRDCDYIIAPIADNRMFQIIDSFAAGEITDEQCRHCLAATNLGNQYVFINQKAVEQLRPLEMCYISEPEKNYYRNQRASEAKLGQDKVKLARLQYRGKGCYIDEILK